MKVLKLLLACVFLLTFTIYPINGVFYAKAVEAEDVNLSGILNISTNFSGNEYSGLIPLTKGFMKLHPNVVINIDSPDDSGANANAEYKAFNENLKVRIMSGEDIDMVFDMSTGLYAELIYGDLLEDLNPYMANDSEYKDEDYFQEIIKLFDSNGSVYVIPTTFDIWFHRLNLEALEAAGIEEDEIDTVSYETLLDIYNLAKENGYPLSSVDYKAYTGQNILCNIELANHIDMNKMTSDFDSESFRTYLEKTKAYDIPFKNTNGGFVCEGFDPFKNEYGMEDKSYLSYRFDSGVWFVDYFSGSYVGASKPYVESASSGNIIAEGVNKLMITKNCDNKDLAWEFVKYCITESETVSAYGEKPGEFDGDRFFGAVPINKNNFRKYYSATCRNISTDKLEEYFSIVEESVKKCSITYFPSLELMNSWYDILTDYYTDIIDTDTCVIAMQERSDMFFSELK